MSADSPVDGDSAPADGENLDTTLLESLFYNEMMMLDDSSDLLTSFTGVTNSGEAQSIVAQAPVLPPGKQAASREASAGVSSVATPTKEGSSNDPVTFAEQSLLRDFGVSGSPIPHISDDPNQKPEGKPQAPGSRVQNGQHLQSAQQGSQPSQEQQQQAWHNGQQARHYQHQNQDPNRYPPHPQYQNHHHHPTQPYHPNSHHPAPHQGYQQTQQQSYIQPRPSQPQVSKGIKHSVKPVQTKPVAEHKQIPVTQQHTSIPNPLSQTYPSHPPAQPSTHPQHPPPHYPPPASHTHPSHHPPPPSHHHHHPPPPHHQPHYHHPHAPPPGTVPAPALVPVPAPGSAHYPQSAYGPPPGTSGHVSPPYNTSPPVNHAVIPVGGHAPAPPPPHGHHHSRPPHPSHNMQHHYPHAHPPKEQLVSQFATLANRLGINLPSDLLSSLTESAGIASAGAEASSEPSPPPLSQASSSQGSMPSKGSASHHPSSNGIYDASSATNKPTSVVSSNTAVNANTPIAEAIRITAEEAIAAVTRKRSSDEAGFGKRNSSSSQLAGSGSESKVSYAKRRKKPRIADCEGRLAHLRAENEKLKRHLDNVTNQTHKFEQDRIKAEETMKQMLDSKDVPEEELDTVIREYSEAYSDYGRRRHEELSFHLEQLQKLANPTNFTKMGLWTIAKANGSKDMSKQNPLVGILQKELHIAPQQVRRILEQRQRIRELVNNLNESLLLLQKLKELCEQKNKTFNDRMSKTREILNPKQVVKLIMWIKEHSNVLGNICPGWTSEQVVKRHKASAPKSTSDMAAVSADNAKSDGGKQSSSTPGPESESK